MIGPVIEAIFAGNGIIIKGSEQTAWSAQYNIQVVKATLIACGHDPELVQVVHFNILVKFTSRVLCVIQMSPNTLHRILRSSISFSSDQNQ